MWSQRYCGAFCVFGTQDGGTMDSFAWGALFGALLVILVLKAFEDDDE